jgi:hypothetical protein
MVQIMKLDQLKIPEKIEINYIQKKYYNKYFYKLVLKVDESQLIKDRTNRYYKIQYTNRFSLLNQLLKKIDQAVLDDDYRVRSEGITVSLFTNSEKNIEKIVNNLTPHVMSLFGPLNSAHVDVIENHKKVLVRNSLFEKKYKFKVYLRPSWEQRENRFTEFKEWLENSNSDYSINGCLNQCFNTNKSMRSIGYTAAIYFNSTEDLMMFQLRFNDKILKIEEAVLLSDLDK